MGTRKMAMGALVVASMLAVTQAGAWAATPGGADTSFGTGGTVTQGTSNSFAGAVYRQPNGQILLPLELGGQAALERMAGNGVPDKSFGVNGIATVPVNRPDPQDTLTTQVVDGYSGFTAVTEASDGTYYAVGYGDSSGFGGYQNPDYGDSIGVIAHLLSNGTLDPSFGEAGVAYTTMTSGGSPAYPEQCGAIPYEVAALPGDQGVVVNTKECPTPYNHANYSPPIRTFNRLGIENTNWENSLYTDNVPTGGYYPPPYPDLHMVVAPDGDLVLNRCFIFTLVGNTETVRQSDDETMAVHLSDGTVDPHYGDGGCSEPLVPGTTSYSGNATTLGNLAEGPNGAVTVLATTLDAPSYQFPPESWIGRLTVAGQPDPTFGDGTGALLSLPFTGTSSPEAISAAISDTGAALVLGSSCGCNDVVPEGEGAAVAALNPDGSVDTTFGTNGVVTLPSNAVVSGIELQPYWRTVVSYTSGPPDCVYGGTFFGDPVDIQTGMSHNPPEACQANLVGLVYRGS